MLNLWRTYRDCGRAMCLVFVLCLMMIWPGSVILAQQEIGSVTAVQNPVHVVHPGGKDMVLVRDRDRVLFLDSYETLAQARLKMLFQDDSLLTLGEKTTLQITENVFNPARNQRSSVMKVLSGRVRVLVGKVFSGTGSKFEVHTPTAVAASRGTYFIIWLFLKDGKAASGVVSLADRVNVSNMNKGVVGTVTIGPNQYTVVVEGKPPTAPATIDPNLLAELLDSTELEDGFEEAIPSLADLISQGITSVLSPVQLLPGRGPSVHDTGLPSEETDLPTTPPIPQQPAFPTSPVDIEISFP
jgi:hypothetical protein